MSNDIIVVIAMLTHLKLITEKEAHALHDELKYKNMSTSLDDCLKLIKEAFKSSHIGENKVSTEIIVDGKTIKVSK